MANLNGMPGLKSDSDTSDSDDDLVAFGGASASSARPFSSNSYTRNPFLYYRRPAQMQPQPELRSTSGGSHRTSNVDYL